MTDSTTQVYTHPANAVFALMEDRDFRHSIIRPALAKDKAGLARLTTGKHQLKGFRNMAKAPAVMLVSVISDEANLSAPLARRILELWLDDAGVLRGVVAAKLATLGYEISESTFDDDDQVTWRPLADDHATEQFDGTFLEGEDPNAVMLMSLLLGWFGSDKDGVAEDEAADAA
jgi:hypothetical protein